MSGKRGEPMAHKQKYTRGSVGHMLGHYDRSKEVPELKAPLNTVLNYNLAYAVQPKNQLEFLHQRLSEVKVHNRKDVNVMVDWVVTIPQSLKDKGLAEEDLFFEEAYNFLNARYGKENVISAYVHYDETTPHMHYAFVPVVEDKKKGGNKLSAKEAVTREDLRTFHKDLSDHMERVFGRDIGILNEATKEGNKSIQELKAGTAQKKLKQIHSKAKELMESTQKLEDASKIREEKLNEAFEKKKSELEVKLGFLQSQVNGTELTIEKMKEIQPEKTFTGAIKGVSLEEIVNLKKTAILGVKTLEENKELLRENQILRNKIVELQKKVPNLIQLTEQATDKSRLLELERLFEKIPPSVKKELFQTKKNTKTFELEK